MNRERFESTIWCGSSSTHRFRGGDRRICQHRPFHGGWHADPVVGFAQEPEAKNGAEPKRTDGDSGNPTVDFHGEKRSNATHQSATDPESLLARKGKGKEAHLCHSGHILMENGTGCAWTCGWIGPTVTRSAAAPEG